VNGILFSNMPGKTNLSELLKTMRPKLNEGEYVFCTVPPTQTIDLTQIIGSFKEAEGLTVILEKSIADELNLNYSYISSWITLTVHSSLEAVGLTAAFSNALAKEGISCNVVAAFYHDHIFVDKKHADKAIKALKKLSADNN
jgi:uncharacterized protein